MNKVLVQAWTWSSVFLVADKNAIWLKMMGIEAASQILIINGGNFPLFK
jgi:hypothetical protein